jgi:hypothetical protein
MCYVRVRYELALANSRNGVNAAENGFRARERIADRDLASEQVCALA